MWNWIPLGYKDIESTEGNSECGNSECPLEWKGRFMFWSHVIWMYREWRLEVGVIRGWASLRGAGSAHKSSLSVPWGIPPPSQRSMRVTVSIEPQRSKLVPGAFWGRMLTSALPFWFLFYWKPLLAEERKIIKHSCWYEWFHHKKPSKIGNMSIIRSVTQGI